MTLSASSSSEPLTFLFYQDRTLSFPSFLIYQFSSGSHCLTWLLCDCIWPPRSQTFSLFCNLFVPSGMLSPVQHFNLPSFYCFIHKVYLGLTRQAFHLMFNIILFPDKPAIHALYHALIWLFQSAVDISTDGTWDVPLIAYEQTSRRWEEANFRLQSIQRYTTGPSTEIKRLNAYSWSGHLFLQGHGCRGRGREKNIRPQNGGSAVRCFPLDRALLWYIWTHRSWAFLLKTNASSSQPKSQQRSGDLQTSLKRYWQWIVMDVTIRQVFFFSQTTVALYPCTYEQH